MEPEGDRWHDRIITGIADAARPAWQPKEAAIWQSSGVLLRIEPAVTGDGHVQEGGMGRLAQYAAALGADWIASSG